MVNKRIKIEKDWLGENYLVMEGGLPFHQVFRGSLEHCQVILKAYVAVGYEDVTAADLYEQRQS